MPAPVPLNFQVTGPAAQATLAVYVRDLWADPWVAAPNLHCESLSFAAAPGVGTASFHHRYGERLKSLESAWSTVSRYAPNPRSYVKVAITPTEGMSGTTTWVGVWRRVTDNGLRQSFCADSIEALLSFVPIRDAYYYDVFGGIARAHCGMTFNEGGRPNRSKDTQPVRASSVYVFDADPERATFWSSQDIVKYLLAAHPPLKTDDTSIFTWNLFDANFLPTYDRPTLSAHNKDVLSLLHSIISRYRLLSFRTEVFDDPGPPASTAVILRPFSFTEEAIPLTNYAGDEVGTIPANPNTFTLDFRRDPSSVASLSIQANHVADRVVVMGGWRQSVFSVSKEDNDLELAWKPLRESEYVEAEETIGAELPPENERHDREVAINRLRSSDRYAEVFSKWRINKLWAQKSSDGEAGVEAKPIALDEDDEAQYMIPYHLLRIQPELPFLSGYKYDDSTIADLAAENEPGHRAGDLFVGKPPHEPLPILVFLKEGESDKWSELSTLGTGTSEIEDIDGTFDVKGAINRHWSGSVRPCRGSTPMIKTEVDPDGLPDLTFRPDGVTMLSSTIQITVQGAPQHVLAAEEFLIRDDGVRGAFDWKKMIVTLAVDDPRQIVVTYPTEPAPEDPGDREDGVDYLEPIGEFINEIVIEVGDEYRQIYVVPNTVVGIDELTAGLKRSTGGYLQDDRDYLLVIAKRAYRWYRTPRYALTFSTGFVSGVLKIGHYITSIRDYNNLLPVGSVITEITLDFPVARGTHTPPPRVTYTTAFGQLDPERVL